PHQLAKVVIWIGYLQWQHVTGFQAPRNPVLDPFENIRHADAIIDLTGPANPKAGMAGCRNHRRQPAVPGREEATNRVGRRLHRAGVPALRWPREGRSRPLLLLVRGVGVS